MYLWVLGPIYLFYIHRHGRCYLRMSRLFKVKMVATGSRDQGAWKGGLAAVLGAGWNLAETPHLSSART